MDVYIFSLFIILFFFYYIFQYFLFRDWWMYKDMKTESLFRISLLNCWEIKFWFLLRWIRFTINLLLLVSKTILLVFYVVLIYVIGLCEIISSILKHHVTKFKTLALSYIVCNFFFFRISSIYRTTIILNLFFFSFIQLTQDFDCISFLFIWFDIFWLYFNSSTAL